MLHFKILCFVLVLCLCMQFIICEIELDGEREKRSFPGMPTPVNDAFGGVIEALNWVYKWSFRALNFLYRSAHNVFNGPF